MDQKQLFKNPNSAKDKPQRALQAHNALSPRKENSLSGEQSKKKERLTPSEDNSHFILGYN